MPEPSVLEQIVRDVVETCKGIKPSAGYSVDVKQVERFRLTDFDDPFPAIAVYSLAEEEIVDGTMGFEERWLELVIEGWLSESVAGKLDEELVAFQADIYAALTQDISRGGAAIDTQYSHCRRG